MIIGIGTDIVKIDRIEHLHTKYGEKFLCSIFTEDEIEKCKKRKRFFSCLALRFAAKEAFLKSLKTGLRDELKFCEIEVVNDDHGAPSIKLYGVAKAFADERNVKHIHLSLSDETDYAVANVVLEG